MLCPVCNGIYALEALCPLCGAAVSDHGKRQDYYGPYSPYQPIDEETSTISHSDSETTCVHIARCRNCGELLEAPVSLWGTISG